MKEGLFRFRHFELQHARSPAKVGTDGVLLSAWTNTDHSRNILDIGTGSGLIALILAQRCPDAHIHAWEIHPDAAEEARENFARSPWADRLSLAKGDAQTLSQQTALQFDLILSNPPFFSQSTPAQTADRQAWRHQSSLSPTVLFAIAAQKLTSRGKIALIYPFSEQKHWHQAAQSQGFSLTRTCKVFSKADRAPIRLLVEYSREKQASAPQESLVLHEEGGYRGYSRAFLDLTREVYPWLV